MQPGKQSLNFPAPPIAPQLATILRSRADSVDPVRRNHRHSLSRQTLIQRITVVSLVANQALGSLVGEAGCECFLDERDFGRASRVKVDGDWSTSAVCHCHELRTLAPLGFADAAAPFLAPAKVPSIKHSSKPKSPCWLKCRARVLSTLSSTPLLTQAANRLWQVWYGGKRSGKSCHRAPVRNIHSTPFITSRASRAGLPRKPTRGLGNKGSISNHCSSVNSSRLAMRLPIVVSMGEYSAKTMRYLQPILRWLLTTFKRSLAWRFCSFEIAAHPAHSQWERSAICRMAAAFMARNSEYAAAICSLCADICQACGDECAKHGASHCQACARACHRCAEECRKMATA